MKTKRYVYELRNDYLSLIENKELQAAEKEKIDKYVKAAERGLITPLETVEMILKIKNELFYGGY